MIRQIKKLLRGMNTQLFMEQCLPGCTKQGTWQNGSEWPVDQARFVFLLVTIQKLSFSASLWKAYKSYMGENNRMNSTAELWDC